MTFESCFIYFPRFSYITGKLLIGKVLKSRMWNYKNGLIIDGKFITVYKGVNE